TGSFKPEKDMTFPVELGEGSTAVEGEHFEFDGAAEIVVPAGKSTGTVTLKLRKYEEDKDYISLKLKSASAQLMPGNYAEAKITISGSIFNRLFGSWKYKAFTNR